VRTSHLLGLKQAIVRYETKGNLEKVTAAERKELLNVMKSPSAIEEDSEQARIAKSLFEPILLTLNSNIVKPLRFEKKYQLFKNYVNALGREQQIDRNTLLLSAPPQLRKALVAAIGFPEEHL